MKSYLINHSPRNNHYEHSLGWKFIKILNFSKLNLNFKKLAACTQKINNCKFELAIVLRDNEEVKLK